MIILHSMRFTSYTRYFTMVGCLAWPAVSEGQGLYNNTNLYINGADMYVEGDVINTGVLDNGGIVSFSGDWQSSSTYEGSGVLRALGNKPQRIQHYAQKINTLQIDGWGTKYIKGTIRITGTLNLVNGIVEVGPNDVLKLGDGAITEGGSPDSYVDGPLTVEGTGYKYFPLGKHGAYAPIEFLHAEGDGPEFSVEVFDNAPTLSVEDVIIRRGLYWKRTDIKGTFGGSAVAVDFEKSFFTDPENIIVLTGTEWKKPFSIISSLNYSSETDKVSTPITVSAPIIMLGEISDRWEESDFFLSTALSANASRVENHTIKIFGDRLADHQFRFQVFNRWGVLIFESTSLENMKNQGWDGRSTNGVQLTSGTYPYRLTAFDQTGSQFEKAGVITIVN